jgi:hypothetical protein
MDDFPTVRIRNAGLKGRTVILYGLLPPALAVLAWWLILGATRNDPPGPGRRLAGILCLGVPALLAGVGCPLEVMRSTVLRLDIGPRLNYLTLLGAHSLDWSGVKSWGFEGSQGGPEAGRPALPFFPRQCILKIELSPWTHLLVGVPRGTEQDLGELIGHWHAGASPDRAGAAAGRS